jgi:hypothetical protein
MSKLIGTSPNQVPSNADLGTAAFKDVKEFLTSRGSSLSAIDKTIVSTAVDVFVYDTRKDSDGGAWRKRCSGTSWYDEEQSETRGSRKEFPSLSVIVAESDKVTIYDADDSNLPMWMVFHRSSGSTGTTSATFLAVSTITTTTATMCNGILYVGFNSGGWGVHEINFVSEEDIWHWQGYTNRKSHARDRTLINRNRETGYITGGTTSGEGLYNPYINHVVAKVLPNASVNPATGLPYPTVLASSDAGVNIIKGDLSHVALYRTSDDDVHMSCFLPDNRIAMGMERGAIYVAEIPDSNQSGNPHATWEVYGGRQNDTGYKPNVPLIGAPSDMTETKDGFAFSSSFDNYQFGRGLAIVSNTTDHDKSMLANISDRTNSGWMVGDCRTALLAGTKKTSRRNYVSNPDFTTGISNWSAAYDATITHDSGKLRATATQASSSLVGAVTTISGLTVGKSYSYACEVVTNVSGDIRIQIAGIGLRHGTGQWSGTGTKYIWDQFTATSTSIALQILNYGTYTTGDYYTIDNVTFKEAITDCSVVEDHGHIFGEVPEEYVAPNAELVAYGPFDNGKYIRVPYTAELNVGSSDYCVMGWVRSTLTSGYSDIISYGNTGDVGYGSSEPGSWFIQLHPSYGWNWYTNTPNGTSSSGWSKHQNNGVNYNGTNQWYFITVVRSGDTITSYENGKFIGSTSSSTIASTWNPSSNLADMQVRIGWQGTAYNYPATTEQIALWRVSKTAPTAAQIEKIYNDEKQLFMPNAKASLYGSNAAAYGVAYDMDTDLLHVGADYGRSTFDGLRRIDNTTEGVGTVMSASNGLVAEE